MKLLKEWIENGEESMFPAAELLYVSADMDELVQLATRRAAEEDFGAEVFWIVPEREEHLSMWMQIREEFRYVIRK